MKQISVFYRVIFLLVSLSFSLLSTYSVFAAKEPKYTKQEAMKNILPKQPYNIKQKGTGKAPVNIAFCKYWGKRDKELNLPRTSSLSLALPYYTTTTISITENSDKVFLNGKEVSADSEFSKRTVEFLDLFRPKVDMYFKVETQNDLPTAAGLASSASGFAAFIMALNDLFGWELKDEQLSSLARIGSGSGARSIYPGFVFWQAGKKTDGTDSYAVAMDVPRWDSLRIGLLVVSEDKKDVSSRDGMNTAVATSPYYSAWVKKTNKDIEEMKKAISARDIKKTGEIAEANALAMHATAITSWPPIFYWSSQTVVMMKKVWELREEHNKNIYFTIDAGPNLVLIFEEKDEDVVKKNFPNVHIVKPLF